MLLSKCRRWPNSSLFNIKYSVYTLEMLGIYNYILIRLNNLTMLSKQFHFFSTYKIKGKVTEKDQEGSTCICWYTVINLSDYLIGPHIPDQTICFTRAAIAAFFHLWWLHFNTAEQKLLCGIFGFNFRHFLWNPSLLLSKQ